jgi:hypothetical protein
MHYHAEVGIPISNLDRLHRFESDEGCRSEDYGEVLADVQRLTDFVLRKYQQDLEPDEMKEYGIDPFWYDEEGDECDETDEGATAYNPEGLWDWYTFGGRWKGTKAPPKYKYMFDSEDSPEIISTPAGDRVKEFWDTLHTSLIGDDIGAPKYVIWLSEAMEIEYITASDDGDLDHTFQEILAAHALRWKDYVWVTCDLHN